MTLPPAAELLGISGESGGVGLAEAGTTTPADAHPDTPPAIASDLGSAEVSGTPSDEILLARFLKGERDALGTLAMRHESQLLGLACALTGRRDLALESVQDTWLKVIKYGRSFKSGSTVKTWLYRILINACKDARTKARPLSTNPERHRAASSFDLDMLAASDISDPPDPPDLSHVRSAVNRLSGDQKLLILLCYHNGLTHPQAAQVLDIPIGTLKSRLHTILNTLRTAMQNPRGHAGATPDTRPTGPTKQEPTP